MKYNIIAQFKIGRLNFLSPRSCISFIINMPISSRDILWDFSEETLGHLADNEDIFLEISDILILEDEGKILVPDARRVADWKLTLIARVTKSTREFLAYDTLEAYLSANPEEKYSIRAMYNRPFLVQLLFLADTNSTSEICQPDSFEDISIDTKTLSLLMNHHSMMPELKTLVANFCERSQSIDEAFSSGCFVSESGNAYGKSS